MRGIFRGTFVIALVSAGAALSGACTTATGDVSGGEPRPFDAAAPSPLVAASSDPSLANASPTSWRGLYRDFFGPSATSTCTGNGTCHDAPSHAGAVRSNFVCVDVDGCWKSLRTAKDVDPKVSTVALVEAANIASPADAYLFKVISYRTPDGSLVPNRKMPQLPLDFAFADADIQRMQTWIRNGAKND